MSPTPKEEVPQDDADMAGTDILVLSFFSLFFLALEGSSTGQRDSRLERKQKPPWGVVTTQSTLPPPFLHPTGILGTHAPSIFQAAKTGIQTTTDHVRIWLWGWPFSLVFYAAMLQDVTN